MRWKGKPRALLVGMQTGADTVENSREFPQKIKNGPAYDPMIPLLGIYPKKLKTLIQKNISTPMFIAVLFTIAKIWKQPKCPSVHEEIKKLWYIYAMEYYSAIKKKEIFFCDSMDDLESIMLSKIS